MVFMLAGKIVLLNLFVMMVMTEFEILRCDPKNQSNDYEALDHIGSKVGRSSIHKSEKFISHRRR